MMPSLRERFDVCEEIMGKLRFRPEDETPNSANRTWWLVTRDVGVDGAGPGVDAAGERLGVGEALIA